MGKNSVEAQAPTKILFLDVDGVLNSYSTQQRFMGFLGIDPELVAVVSRIIKQTGCSVVLSSSWRTAPETRRHVRRHIEFIDITPDNRGLTDRGCEIIDWLKNHPEVEVHAILDDASDFHKEQPLFKTSMSRGVTRDIANEVIKHLGGKS